MAMEKLLSENFLIHAKLCFTESAYKLLISTKIVFSPISRIEDLEGPCLAFPTDLDPDLIPNDIINLLLMTYLLQYGVKLILKIY